MRSLYRISLPPLDTLIFFEAALRHGSFTKAADELLISQAAVSKRVRQLENWLDVALFERHNQRLIPTRAGLSLGERINNILDFIIQSINEVKEPYEPVVRIASTIGIGTFWLQPRLQSFTFSDAACAYNLTLAPTPHSFFKNDFDLIVIYGNGNIPGWISHKLIDEEVVPVASPHIAAALSQEKQAAAISLLEYRRRTPEWVNWALWKKLQKSSPFNLLSVKTCSSYTQTIGMALAGKGIALGSLPMLENELCSGKLVRLGEQGLITGRAYFLARRENIAVNDPIASIWTTLTGRACAP